MDERIKRGAGGFLTGAANSLFGGGGGMLAVPMLQKFGMEERKAHASAILVILPVSVVSLSVYFYKGLYDFSVLLPVAIGSVAGGAVGAATLDRISGKAVGIAFSLLQFAAGAWMLFFS